MLIYLMRHGIAEDAALGEDDFGRALTGEGRDRTHRAAQGLAKLVAGNPKILSSPKTRARQTAQIVRDVLGGEPVEIWEPLQTGPTRKNLLQKIEEIGGDTIFVGHEPFLSELASQLLVGEGKMFSMDFKKAGVCIFSLDEDTKTITLEAFLPPKALRKMSGK